MGAIKEFYHEEICQGQKEAAEDEAIISKALNIEEDLNNAQLPKWMHPDASLGGQN